MLRFEIGLFIKHPFMDPDEITDRLDLEPFRCWRQGEPRSTPKGKSLPGVNPDTYWIHAFWFRGERLFFRQLQILLNDLETHRDFFDRITSEGGRISLNVQLAGDENIGDVLDWKVMGKLAELKISVSIEVFPCFPEDNCPA